MSDCSTTTETPSSGEQEPTMVSVPVVGSSATDNMATSWDNGATLNIQESSRNLCELSLCNDPIPSSAALTSVSQMPSTITHSDIAQEPNCSASFMHSGISQDPDSTSGSLSVCEEERMIVDSQLPSALSVHAISTQESISISQESENSDDHLNAMESIAAQSFLHDQNLESDLLNATASALHHSKNSATAGDDINKTNISTSLMSSLDHQSVSSTQEQEPMEMQSLLHNQDLDDDGPVSSIAGYHLEHSQTSELSVGSTSQLDIGVTIPGGMRADSVCLSPSSTSSTSSLDLPSGTCISSGIGLPPVSTIIRSSVAKGRFDAFCRPTNISMIMGIPQFLNSNNSFDAMTSMGTLQRMTSNPCDALTAVSLASPLEVSSSRHNTCTDISMESVDVPLSSSLVCSSTSSGHNVTAVESGCIKPTSSVMSSLGPDIMNKQNSLADEMSESQMQSESITLTSTSDSMPPFVGIIPIRQMINIGASPTQVSLHVSPMRIEDIHKVTEISEHLRSETPVSTTYTLCTNDDSLAHAMIPHNFNCREEIEQTDNFAEGISQTSQPPPLLPVSAIETNVIMSTSNIDAASKLTNAEMKVIETSQRLNDHQLQNLRTINHRLENTSIPPQILIPHSLGTSRNSDIIYSSVQTILSSHEVDTTTVFTSTAKTTHSQNSSSRSSIIEKHVMQQPQIAKSEPSVISSLESEVPSTRSSVQTVVDSNTMVSKASPKLTDRILLDDSGRESLSTVSPTAVAASVIQQLLTAQNPPPKLRPILQRIPGGVITSVMSAKGEPSIVHRESTITPTTLSVASDQQTTLDIKSNINQPLDLPVTTTTDHQNTLLVNVSDEKQSNVTVNLSESSLCNQNSKAASVLASSVHPNKDITSLPSLASVALPSLFPNLSASTLASLQSSLSSSAIPLTIPTSLPNVTLGVTASTVSLLSSVQSGLVSPPIPAVPPILLPSILSSTLRSAVSTIKSPIVDSISSSGSMPTANASLYSGLLKTVGLSTVVKQEPGVTSGSGPLPPFTVVSGLSPLVKRDLGGLATSLLGANHTSSQIPVVTIKQEPGVAATTASASEFSTPTILSAGSTLPSIASMHLPSVTPVGLSVVVTSSTAAAATVPTITSPVPSQASTIAFAGNASVVPATTSSAVSVTANKEQKTVEKKWNCPMCKNGSPCGLHPTQPQGSSSQTPPQPLLSGDPAKPFQCTLCGKHLASKNVYQLHLRSHSGEKPFTCNLCGHHFSQKTSLTRHMRSHTGERPFPCEVCGKRFADKERIKIHMRTHTGEKPFACEVCGKRFSQKSTVKRHMSVHTGEKPFKCEACGKGFANRGNLNAHSKTHANT